MSLIKLERSKTSLATSLFLCLGFYTSSCDVGSTGSFSAEPDFPGMCSLNCKNAIIAGNDGVFKMTPSKTDFTITCGKLQDASVPIKVHLAWHAYQTYKDGDAENRRGIPRVSFGVSGIENVTSIETPKDKFCSDSCGVMSLDFSITCPASGESNKFDILAFSGGLFSDSITGVSISTLQ